MQELDTEIVLEAPVKKAGGWLSAIETEALACIREKEEKLLQKHGIRVSCGIELELFLKERLMSDSRPDVLNALKSFVGKVTKDAKIIERIYIENGTDTYEVVVGRRKDDQPELLNEQDIKKTSPSIISRVTAFLKHKISEDFSREHGFEPDFRASDWDNPAYTSSTHVNSSIINSAGQNLLMDKKFAKMIMKNVLETQDLFFPLIVSGNASLDRFKYGTDSPNYIVGQMDSRKSQGSSAVYRFKAKNSAVYDGYIEDRIAGGDVSPILASLVHLCAIEHAMDTKQKTSRVELPLFSIPSNKETMEASLQEFKNNPRAKEQLGSKLFDRLLNEKEQVAGRIL